MAEKFDAIIIGTGQSGPSLAARMTGEGMKTAIIERKLFGGTCVNVFRRVDGNARQLPGILQRRVTFAQAPRRA